MELWEFFFGLQGLQSCVIGSGEVEVRGAQLSKTVKARAATGNKMTSSEKSKLGHPPHIQDELPAIIRLLRKPAGDDPRFASVAAINANRNAFTEAVHSAWKHLHSRSLDEILAIEKALSSAPREKLPGGFVWYLERSIALWRRINDAIVWSLVREQDHVIRRVCQRKDRPRLSDANPTAIREFLDNFNSDPQSIAIWSDATTCVDLGDLVCRSFSGELNGFIEAKAGAMNDRIFELMEVKGNSVDVMNAITDFADKYGPKAVKQLQRVVKQRHRYNQVMDIIEKDRGFDPRQEAEIVVQDTITPLKRYDPELQAIIDASRDGPVLCCVDRCLWVYVEREQSKDPAEKVKSFECKLAEASPTTLQWFNEQFGGKEPFGDVLLEDNLICPEAIPLFLRQLEPETVRDVLIGNLMFSVFLFVDWRELGIVVEELGAELVWSTQKEGRSQRSKPMAQRQFSLGDRIPRVQLENEKYIEGFSKIYRVLFDGITPTSIAAQYVEVLKSDKFIPPANSD